MPFNGFGDLRNRAIEACKYEWIFSLDADERCTEEVRDEILKLLIAGPPPYDVYRVPRRSYMMGRWIRGSGWYPNFRQPQLFRKGSMRYTLEPVHEGYEILSGKPVGTLKQRHLAIPVPQSGRSYQEDEPLLLAWRAETCAASACRWRARSGTAMWSFLKHYIFKLGFIDGWAGFVIALGNFEGTFYRYAKRYEEAQGWQPPPSKPIRRDADVLVASFRCARALDHGAGRMAGHDIDQDHLAAQRPRQSRGRPPARAYSRCP